MSDQQLIDDHIEYHEKIRGYGHEVTHFVTSSPTLKAHRRILANWVRFITLSDTTLTKANGELVITFISLRQSEKVLNSTIMNELCIIRGFYEFLSGHKHHHNMPHLDSPTLLCETTDEQKYLTVDECMAFLNGFDCDTADGRRNHTIFALIWSTGLRTSELTALKWKYFDFENESFRVRKGKGRKERQLFLNDRLLQDILLYQSTISHRANDPVFPALTKNAATVKGEKITALTSSTLQGITRDHAATFDLDKKVTPKTFRHTFATHMFEAGLKIEDIKEMMGHSDATETTVYIHVTLDAIRTQLRYAHANTLRK